MDIRSENGEIISQEELALAARRECASDVTTAHHGGGAGRPFWNACSSQFMYNPAFDFAGLPGRRQYRFDARQEDGTVVSFEAPSPRSLLTPIWDKLPQGMITLTVTALDADGRDIAPVGARTFYKCAPFRADYPPAARPYREAAVMALDHVFGQELIRYWLAHTKPDPRYDFYVYPSKTISAVIVGMLRYAALRPDRKEQAMQIAVTAADYLLSISFPENAPFAGLPPTYHLGFREHPERYNNETAVENIDRLMMTYPADVGGAYLALEKATGDPRYLRAALRIADVYREKMLPCGSWHLICSVMTGRPVSGNLCMPYGIAVFLRAVMQRTGDASWGKLADKAMDYQLDQGLRLYNWEGQFEDSPQSDNYSNMTHLEANHTIRYLAETRANDPEAIACAEDLMRYVEDQFVIWDKPSCYDSRGNHPEYFPSPAVLEQYQWYIPVDDSAATTMLSFMTLYKATGKPLYLAKARALGDMITRMQNEKTGMIPTQWHTPDCRESENGFWASCEIKTACRLLDMAKALGE